MQFHTFGDLGADFTFVEIDNPEKDLNIGVHLEKNIITIEPFYLKLIFTPLQKLHLIRMSEIVIFHNFEIIFDLTLLSRSIFSVSDTRRFTRISSVIDKLRLRYGQNAENCRFIFTNNVQGMTNMDPSTTNVNSFSQFNDVNSYLNIVTNVFCFQNMDSAITFNSQLLNMYNSFVGSCNANHLFYFNKSKINNLKIIFKKSKMNSSTNTAEYSSFSTHTNPYNNLSNFNVNYAFLNFSKEGALFADAPGDTMKNVLYTFTYDTIRDCHIEMIPKTKVLPRDMLITESSKCCLRMRIDVKEVYDNILDVCSYKTSIYQCNLEAKFIQENLSNKCGHKLIYSIGFAFDNNYNIREYIMSIIF
jgi:hypothetical protein